MIGVVATIQIKEGKGAEFEKVAMQIVAVLASASGGPKGASARRAPRHASYPSVSFGLQY